MNIFETLIGNVTEISKKIEDDKNRTGDSFNIFKIINKEHNEVVICKVIAELLSPSGCHHQNTVFLEWFSEKVLDLKLSDDELKRAKVYTEYLIYGSRRIDIVIETGSRLIPIEVKIYAEDQEKQCFDYWNKARNSKLYYLTISGNPPSEGSALELLVPKEGTESCIQNISFKTDILEWLDACLEYAENNKLQNIQGIILQLRTAIKKFSNLMEDKEMQEIGKLISGSLENLDASIKIENALKHVRQELLKNIFEKVEDKVISIAGKEDLKIKRVDNNYDYAKKIGSFYNNHSSNKPGISFKLNEAIKDENGVEVDICVRLEIDNRIFLGYYMPNAGAVKFHKIDEKELNKNIILEKLHKSIFEGKCDTFLAEKESSWWAFYEYCKVNGEPPNFWNPNAAYQKLFNPEELDKFTTKISNRIVELMKS